MSGNCVECKNTDCFCRESHNKTELVNQFTETASNLLPNSPEELKQILRDNPRQSQQLTVFEEPIEEIKPNRWITLEEQKSWCDCLSTLGIETGQLGWCASV